MTEMLPRFLPRMILKGASGWEVKAVQEALISCGYRIQADGNFGQGTQSALRSFQVHKGLFPSGVIDQETVEFVCAALHPPERTLRRNIKKPFLPAFQDPVLSDICRHETAVMAQTQAFPWMVSLPPSILNLSWDGLRFIYQHETLPGKSEHLHWPQGQSGVTIGPGYDMRNRTSAEIVSDLIAADIAPALAQQLSKGAGLDHRPAELFAQANKNLLTLTSQQQMQLLKRIAPRYEAIVKRHITIDLFQFEYDALVSFVYNPCASFVPIARDINAGYAAKAMKTVRIRIGLIKSLQAGLQKRRDDEIALFMYGKYGQLPSL